MDVHERLVEDVFYNPKHRPRFIVTVNHGTSSKDAFHAGVGTIDPRSRNSAAHTVRSVIRNVSDQLPYSIHLDHYDEQPDWTEGVPKARPEIIDYLSLSHLGHLCPHFWICGCVPSRTEAPKVGGRKDTDPLIRGVEPVVGVSPGKG